MNSDKRYDVIVVGLGAMGSAACYHLAKQGARVLGLEKFDIPHANGSSTGFSRMIRMSYHEHPDYVPLLKSAFALWRDLEAESGQKVLHATGGLYMGPADGAVLSGAMGAALKFNLPFERLSHPELRRRFPQFHLPENFAAMIEENAGFVLPELAIATHALLAMRRGAELHGRQEITGWSARGACVEVTTARGSHRADRLLFCGGAWTEKIIRDLGIPLRVTRQVLGWVWPKKPEAFEYARLPVWQIDHLDGSVHYGFPMMPDNPGFKLAHHIPMTDADPDSVQRSPMPGDEESFRTVLRENIPDADGPLLALRTCLYTNSPDAHFIIDHLPAHPNVVVACGFSGHGFKFATVMGQALAELAFLGKTAHPVGFLGFRGLGVGLNRRVGKAHESEGPKSGFEASAQLRHFPGSPDRPRVRAGLRGDG